MTQAYPLYDYLLSKIKSTDLVGIDVRKICNTINNISNTLESYSSMEHYRELQALIIHHDLITNGGILLANIPYDGKTLINGKGILYNMKNFPILLQQIIAQYIEEYAA